jgi:hypothetical protein
MKAIFEIEDYASGKLYGFVAGEYHRDWGGIQCIKHHAMKPTMMIKIIDTIPWSSWRMVPSFNCILSWRRRWYL